MRDNRLEEAGRAADYLRIQSAEGMEYQLEIAGMGARSYAFLIDWHIRLLLAITWVASVGWAFFSWEELRNLFEHGHASAALALLVPPASIYLFYHPLLEILMGGRTPGKRMTGVRLVDSQGHTPGIGALLLRNVFRLIDSLPGFYFLGLAAVALTSKQQRIGDLAAGLVLVYDKAAEAGSLRGISDLAIHSGLSANDQALLLDLLMRWNELPQERRTLFARQFLTRIGRTVPPIDEKLKPDRALKQALDDLLTKH
ncbi:RDD family protein [Methylomonas sp. LL1]|uniref:RDD family protein n=1 Tax=Methylomonas sp. LL1 TaxID=2785785 RepID=UPI0018C3924B|nr:RDD family protein [Methylomonas sp. LL1]QPK63741.1 RDD family protein [Methylomonas sp. LL1]